MKIIAETENGFLVEATQVELLLCTGCEDMPTFIAQNGDGHVNTKSSYKWEWYFKVGAAFDVTTAHKWIQKLRANEKQIIASADILGNLSEMLRQGIPSSIVPPTQE
jgi:hypothetical protein